MEDLFAILHVYHSFKLFMARMVGFVAIIYGAVAWKPYFLILGLALVMLFWIFDRMGPRPPVARRREETEPPR